MAKIIGSIDNAGQLKGIFYLIFTEDEMLKFETMSTDILPQLNSRSKFTS